jgi:hypothetical protein
MWNVLAAIYWNWGLFIGIGGSLLELGGSFWNDRYEGCAAICSLGRCSQNLIPSHLHGLNKLQVENLAATLSP